MHTTPLIPEKPLNTSQSALFSQRTAMMPYVSARRCASGSSMQPPQTKAARGRSENPISSGRWYTSTAYVSRPAPGGGMSSG